MAAVEIEPVNFKVLSLPLSHLLPLPPENQCFRRFPSIFQFYIIQHDTAKKLGISELQKTEANNKVLSVFELGSE
jgi:hypothetical protein